MSEERDNVEVWIAHDAAEGRDVVLKRARLTGNGQGALGRLQAAARALDRLKGHPHVVALYETRHVEEGEAAGFWLVVEYGSGGSLDQQPRMRPEQAARIGAQIADALTALHAEGIVHCDVKPGNVVLTGDGTAKLTDFDSAYRVAGRVTVTPNAPLSYTPDYAAREIARGNIPIPESDVFSLAATLHALVAGKPPRPWEHSVEFQAERGVIRVDDEVTGPLRDVLSPGFRS
ncbi:MAG: protein kinase [Streptosporangiales bacterium]|nr:protein kinase [Streptosporangiales bacterium]